MYSRISVFSIFLILLTFSSCDQNESPVTKTGQASFSFTELTNSGGRIESLPMPAFVSYSIKKADGSVINNKIELYEFSGKFISVPVQLHEGDYTLEQFLILENDNTVIYAAPTVDSELAELVNHPLPLSFKVNSSDITDVVPEVISVASYDPDDFGYVSWSYSIGARPVKFLLPVSSNLISNIQSAAIQITQGSYTRTKSLNGTPELSAEIMIKSNAPVTISLIVNAKDVYIDRLPMNPNMSDDVLYNSSISQFEFTSTLTTIAGDQMTLPVFNHKLGNGWDFRFAEITSHGKNQSWFKVSYKKGETCNPTIEIITNAASFESQTVADKIVWFGSGEQVTPIGMWNFFNQPVCSGENCKLTADFASQNEYAKFASACEENQWAMFDSEIRITSKLNGETSFITTYFNLEKTTSSSGRMKLKRGVR